MPRGAIPKPARIRDYDNKQRVAEIVTLEFDGALRGPDLPEGDWPAQTVALYDAIRRDPISQGLTPVDFLHVVDTMSLHRQMWIDQPANAMKVAAEVRLRLQSLGVTPEARMRLRMHVATEPKPKSKLEELLEKNEARKVDRHRSTQRRRVMKLIDAEAEDPMKSVRGY
jgi:hypothetical protein